MDRGIWCTSALRIRTWEIGTAGTEWGGWAGNASYVPFRRWSRHHLGGTYRLLHAQLARATRGGARVLLAVCSETVASQTHGRVGRRLEMQLSGPALYDQGLYLWQRGLLLNPECLIVTAQQRTRIDSSGTVGRAVLRAKAAYRVYSAPVLFPSSIFLPTWATARRGLVVVWAQTDRLKTDIAGGPVDGPARWIPTVSWTFSTVTVDTSSSHKLPL